ncbi:MAG: PP2C family protein-serine/threonine phosphatase [Chloroflexota bacterium]
MILETANASHRGLVRSTNEDALGSHIPDDPVVLARKGTLFGVADGLGGHAAGEVASRVAVEALFAEYYSPRAAHQVEGALRQAMQAANLRVFGLAYGVDGADEALHGMQTTLTALALAGGQAYLAHVGDSRAYVLRDGQLTQLTGDHSEAAELLRLRLITPEQARDHPRRGVLTRTLGAQPQLRPDFSRRAVRPGDRFLLCTDGLWGELDHDTLCRVVQQPPNDACQELVDLACRHGGSDNVSLHVIRVIDPGMAPQSAPPGRLGRLLAGLRGG